MKTESLNFRANIRSVPRGDGTDSIHKIVGLCAVYGQLSEDLGGFREMIAPGAFTKTLREGSPKVLWNHDANYVLGSVKAGTATFTDTAEGLQVEAIPPDTGWARDFLTSIKRGDVDQMSFQFRTIQDDWTCDEDGNVIRTLKECQLFEGSPVTFPAYLQTSVALRDRFGTDDIDEVRAKIAGTAQEPPAPANGNTDASPSSGKDDGNTRQSPAGETGNTQESPDMGLDRLDKKLLQVRGTV